MYMFCSLHRDFEILYLYVYICIYIHSHLIKEVGAMDRKILTQWISSETIFLYILLEKKWTELYFVLKLQNFNFLTYIIYVNLFLN